MTREQAITEFYMALMRMPPGMQVNSHNWCGGVIDGLISIGVLKPESSSETPLQALGTAMRTILDSGGPMTAARVNGILERDGFKIVRAG